MIQGHPLFGPGQLGEFWQIAAMGDKFPDDARDALLGLAKHRDVLPAPVYFQVPEGAQEDSRWQELIAASHSQCICPARRMLVPERGRARLVPHDMPTLMVLKKSATPVLMIVPHGGDLAAAHMSWSFDRGWPVCQELPQRQERPDQQSVTFAPGSTSPNYRKGDMHLKTRLLTQNLRRHGEIICYRTLSNGNGFVTVPVCSILSVRVGETPEDVHLTIELDASVSGQFVKPDETPARHVCAG